MDLMALRAQQLEPPAFRLLVIGLHECETLAGRLMGLLAALEGQEAPPSEHLEAAVLTLGS
jgi:hypothetical protein